MHTRLLGGHAVGLGIGVLLLVPVQAAAVTAPAPHSTRGMSMRITPASSEAGTQFKGIAGRFIPGEYVTVWDFTGRKWKRSSWLLGGDANARGKVEIHRDTVSVSIEGKHKLCARGERSRRVACGNYRVKRSSTNSDPTDPGYQPPTTGPGYVPPGSS